MFDSLTERFHQTLKRVKGQGRLSENNITEALQEVRAALLEADVALPVVKDFLERVKERGLGKEVQASLTPGQAFIKIVHQELIEIMGRQQAPLSFHAQPPAVFLMAGLQGAGKTTTVAKLARWLKENGRKRVAVVSVDVYRPAAIEQLKTLANEVSAEFIPSDISQKPVDIAKSAREFAKRKFMDVLIVDSAGRLHIDGEMMDEIKAVHAAINPIETLFVVDAMTGQDAANTAKAFHEALPLTGVILTKTDGDARGGAALSIRHITGKPIKFLGVGEKTAALELFHPDRLASRILGMGDMLSLIEEVERKVDREKAEKLARKIEKGKLFTLQDYQEQLFQLKNLGGLSSMLDKLPGGVSLPQNVKDRVNDKDLFQQIAIINSMTKQERKQPDILNNSRKQRIAKGSGTQMGDVNRMLKQFEQMQHMMKKFKKGNLPNMMRGLKGNMGRGMPF